MPSAHSEVAALSPSGLRSPPTPAQGDGQPRASFRRCRKGEKRESGRESAQPGPGLPTPRRRTFADALVASAHSMPTALRHPGCACRHTPALRARAAPGLPCVCRAVAADKASAPAYGRRAKPGSAHAVVAPWQRRRHLLRLMLAKQTPGSMQAMRAPWRLHSQSLRVAARRRSAAAAVARMCDRSAFEPHLGCGSECPSENRQDAGVSRVFSRASRPLRAVRGCRCR